MKTNIHKALFYFWALLFLSGCSSGIKVISDKDPSEDFTVFKTFEFAGWTKDSDQILTRFDKERIEKAFSEEARIRGITPVTSGGDIIAALFVIGDVKTQTTANTMTTGMSRGRGMRSPGWGWGAAHSTTVINESQYIVGTLMIEVFDVVDKKLIWQAIGSKTISENPQVREEGIPDMVSAIMDEYPVKPIK